MSKNQFYVSCMIMKEIGGDQLPEDIKVVALVELVKNDSTLNEVFDLEFGEEAEREMIGGKWIRNKIKFDDEE